MRKLFRSALGELEWVGTRALALAQILLHPYYQKGEGRLIPQSLRRLNSICALACVSGPQVVGLGFRLHLARVTRQYLAWRSWRAAARVFQLWRLHLFRT